VPTTTSTAAGTAFTRPQGVLRNYPHGSVGDRMRLNDLMRLMEQGASFRQIAEEIGYVNEQGARRAVNRARKAMLASVATFTTRQFGVEIEMNGISRRAALDALLAAGIDAQDIGYTHSVVSYWKVLTDASVGGTGLEIVSPPLSGQAGLDQLTKVMDTLAAAGGTVDQSCGMHVHLDMAGLTADQIIGFVGFYADRQESLDMVLAKSRRGDRNNYCRSISPDEVASAAVGIRAGGTGLYVQRYRKINVMSYPQYGTIEVRHHQGTLSATKAVAWIRLLQSMVIAGSQGLSAPLSLAGMLATLVAQAGLDEASAQFLTARAEAFGFGDRIGSATDEPVSPPEVTPADAACTCAGCSTLAAEPQPL
jgi:Putative amidoligase enzyme